MWDMSNKKVHQMVHNQNAKDFAEDRDSSGFFILTEETNDFIVPDPAPDQEQRIIQAIEIFDNSLNEKVREKAPKVYVIS